METKKGLSKIAIVLIILIKVKKHKKKVNYFTAIVTMLAEKVLSDGSSKNEHHWHG